MHRSVTHNPFSVPPPCSFHSYFGFYLVTWKQEGESYSSGGYDAYGEAGIHLKLVTSPAGPSKRLKTALFDTPSVAGHVGGWDSKDCIALCIYVSICLFTILYVYIYIFLNLQSLAQTQIHTHTYIHVHIQIFSYILSENMVVLQSRLLWLCSDSVNMMAATFPRSFICQ